MAFITKQEAEDFLREYHNDNYVLAGEEETFEEVLDSIEDNLDMLTPNVVYAFHVFKEQA
jgi:hypothetical protein